MKDWVNKEVISKAIITVLSDRFNPMSAVDVLNDISDIVKEDELLSKADICREFAGKVFERFGKGKSLHDVIVDVLAEMEGE